MAEGKALTSCAYYQRGVESERRAATRISSRSLLKSWAACVIGSAVAFGLVVGVREWRSLATASLTGGSVGVVVSALVGRD